MPISNIRAAVNFYPIWVADSRQLNAANAGLQSLFRRWYHWGCKFQPGQLTNRDWHWSSQRGVFWVPGRARFQLVDRSAFLTRYTMLWFDHIRGQRINHAPN